MKETVFISPQQKLVFDIFKKAQESNSGPPRISDIAQQIDSLQSHASFLVKRLVDKRLLKRVSHGKYTICFDGNVIEGVRRRRSIESPKTPSIGRVALTPARRKFIETWAAYEKENNKPPNYANIAKVLGISREMARQHASHLILQGYLEVRLKHTSPSANDLKVLEAFDSVNKQANIIPNMDDFKMLLPSMSKKKIKESLGILCKLGYLVKRNNRYYRTDPNTGDSNE